MQILIIASFPESLLQFRGSLIASMLASGLSVHVAAPGLFSKSKTRYSLETMGVEMSDLPLQRTGTNPAADLLFFGASLGSCFVFVRQ